MANLERNTRRKAYECVKRLDAKLEILSRTPKQLVDSVLHYLENLERAARLRNRRREYQHLEDCWELVHRVFYGDYLYPAVPIQSVPAQVVASPRTQMKWFQEVQATPLRRVIKTTAKDGICVLTLECRHRVESFHPDTRKHVRCKQCRKLARLNESASQVRDELNRIQKRGDK